jgi:hypothetical protein
VNSDLELLDVQILNEGGQSTNRILYSTDVTVRVRYRCKRELQKPIFFIGVHTTDFIYIATESTEHFVKLQKLNPGDHEVRCTIRRFPFLPGVYALRLAIAAGEFLPIVFYAENVLFFQVIAREGTGTVAIQEGFVSVECDWAVESATQKILPKKLGERLA